MTSNRFRFDRFVLDGANRRLMADGIAVEINARYLDALLLLVRERGGLVTKERFMEDVWRGVPVTDEALTQCIKTLRRHLGDSAASPRFIETVPKHGYRFLAEVTVAEVAETPRREAHAFWPALFLMGGAGTLGAGAAGLLGGLLYGLASTTQAAGSGMGTFSTILVLIFVTGLIATLGGAGVSFGMAAAISTKGRTSLWSIAGAAMGGIVVGAFVKLLGQDALILLFGHTPGNITGAAEGAVLGAAVGWGLWLANRHASSLESRIGFAALAGAGAGLAIPLLGGRMMGGSLDLLARNFPQSRLSLDPIGGLLGETGFGFISQTITGALEGGLFAGCIVGAILLAQGRQGTSARP